MNFIRICSVFVLGMCVSSMSIRATNAQNLLKEDSEFKDFYSEIIEVGQHYDQLTSVGLHNLEEIEDIERRARIARGLLQAEIEALSEEDRDRLINSVSIYDTLISDEFRDVLIEAMAHAHPSWNLQKYRNSFEDESFSGLERREAIQEMIAHYATCETENAGEVVSALLKDLRSENRLLASTSLQLLASIAATFIEDGASLPLTAAQTAQLTQILDGPDSTGRSMAIVILTASKNISLLIERLKKTSVFSAAELKENEYYLNSQTEIVSALSFVGTEACFTSLTETAQSDSPAELILKKACLKGLEAGATTEKFDAEEVTEFLVRQAEDAQAEEEMRIQALKSLRTVGSPEILERLGALYDKLLAEGTASAQRIATELINTASNIETTERLKEELLRRLLGEDLEIPEVEDFNFRKDDASFWSSMEAGLAEQLRKI